MFCSRSGANGVVQEDIYGVVAAAFSHFDSRAGDPQLHDHVVSWTPTSTARSCLRAVPWPSSTASAGCHSTPGTAASPSHQEERPQSQILTAFGVDTSDWDRSPDLDLWPICSGNT